MKSRYKRARPQPEECGVWLDASQLKNKSHQAVIPCTSSRFNPLSRRQSTDSVLVEFTQTKPPPFFSKQTSMYSFYSPAGNRSKQHSIAEIDPFAHKTSPECEKSAQKAPNVMKPSPIGAFTCLEETYSDCEPAENLERPYFYKICRNTEKPVSSGHYENDERSCVLEKPGGLSNASMLGSQEKILSPPTNYWATSFGWKYQNNLFDSSVSKCPLEDYNKEARSPSQCDSPLFTQDTQGNRVICHRSTRDRRMNAYSATPLQDRTNVTYTTSPMKGTPQTLCDEESFHKMFSQDSEGNLVIKH
ncbi:palmitoyl-protein thioesterase ABHD10, mitochondrial isoform X1 [Rhinoderma darwinii]|uniref:palmitoyl-protein thioesterase ABHD10, mitochondrial isoform X1 n=1 Tax=Rhinoderma darwinii TaxID=43563 RepID=UPI003F66AEBD